MTVRYQAALHTDRRRQSILNFLSFAIPKKHFMSVWLKVNQILVMETVNQLDAVGPNKEGLHYPALQLQI